ASASELLAADQHEQAHDAGQDGDVGSAVVGGGVLDGAAFVAGSRSPVGLMIGYRAGMERWHIPSSEADGRREPRVLFSCQEARAVVIDLRDGEQLGEHSVHERAVLQVVDGRLEVAAGDAVVTCESGTLVTFAPGERHAVTAR